MEVLLNFFASNIPTTSRLSKGLFSWGGERCVKLLLFLHRHFKNESANVEIFLMFEY